MPPRFAYWTIIVDGKPTAFRAQLREELEPTFKQIHNKHPDAVMMWFAKGRLWASPEEARATEHRGGERRDREWRPGGEQGAVSAVVHGSTACSFRAAGGVPPSVWWCAT